MAYKKIYYTCKSLQIVIKCRYLFYFYPMWLHYSWLFCSFCIITIMTWIFNFVTYSDLNIEGFGKIPHCLTLSFLSLQFKCVAIQIHEPQSHLLQFIMWDALCVSHHMSITLPDTSKPLRGISNLWGPCICWSVTSSWWKCSNNGGSIGCKLSHKGAALADQDCNQGFWQPKYTKLLQRICWILQRLACVWCAGYSST